MYFKIFWLLLLYCSTIFAQNWSQIGGENRNFNYENPLPRNFLPQNAAVAWERTFPENKAGLTLHENRAYVFYHEGNEDVLTALIEKTGETIWETRYDEPFPGSGYGPGPNAAPLITDEQIFTISGNGKLRAYERINGKFLWQKDFVETYNSEIPWHGYAATPIVYQNTIIAPIGGEEIGIAAFDMKTGELKWSSDTLYIGYASPILIEVENVSQLVLFAKRKVLALNPNTGTKIWEIQHDTTPLHNAACLPLWHSKKQILWIGVRSGNGLPSPNSFTTGIKIEAVDSDFTAKKLWKNGEIFVEAYANAVLIDEIVYVSVGGGRRSMFTAQNIETGKKVWDMRGFQAAKMISAMDKLLILDEVGRFVLAKPTETGLDIIGERKFTFRRNWTLPAMNAHSFLLRDGNRVIALKLQ